MSVVALSSTVFSAIDGDTYVSSAQTYPTRCFLNADYDQNDVVRFEATSSGPIEVLTASGRRIGIVPGYRAAVLVQRGDDDNGWVLTLLPVSPATLVAAGSDLATTQALANAIRTIMLNSGLMKAE